jgi:hypothetical protein
MTPEPSLGILSLAPVTLALVLAFLTRNAVFSLLVGCIAGVVMAGVDPATGLAELFQNALGNPSFIWVMMIEVAVGIMVAFYLRAGVITAFSEWASQRIRTRRAASGFGWLMGIFVFFSDYFSPIFSGPIARPLTGRFFTSLDDGEHPPVAIVDEKLARLAWPGQDPIGRKLKVKLYSWRDDSVVWAEVVGVVEHVRNTHLAFEGREQIYLPHLQAARRSMTVAVAGPIGASSLAAAVRRELREIDPGRAIFDVRPLDHYVAADLAQSRFLLLLLALLAGLAAVLATVGIYGVIACSVRLRIAELGVRLALGAQASQIILLVVGSGLRLAGSGVALGVAVAFVAGRGMKSLVYGISVHDGATFLTVVGLAFIVALAAAYLPARQASRIDPVTALRDE